jgi:hypothetical protein
MQKKSIRALTQLKLNQIDEHVGLWNKVLSFVGKSF